ncbi:hypothetical protein KQ876_01420 [Mycoplasma sp. CSL7491-lung]|uniref:hypothetical protein n=1 Tax=Mycoplasma sp. CSL7491-lung TaxID=549718 RepID=UPI001C10EC98|nr:hypothetical protein [Mycoplasma sp. CSL7491-lung]MBU4692865.1 hypothetical protein [Mycoplasma sp. CSL7491-lung]
MAIPTHPVVANSDDHEVERSEETVYVRPPFGASFELKSEKNFPNIVTVFDHLDSPGKKNNSRYNEYGANTSNLAYKSYGSSLGSQEASEFLSIPKLMKYYKKHSKENSLVIFGGDTNIEKENFNLDNNFDPEINKVLNSYGIGQKYFTSLNKNGTGYVQPYDKIYYLNGENKYYDLVNDNDDPHLDFKIDIIKEFKKFNNKEEFKSMKWYNNHEDEGWNIRNRLSDHAPVYVDLNIKTNKNINTSFASINPKKDTNQLRIAHWNILNYGNQNLNTYKHKKEFKYKAIAYFIEKSGFDIVGLTEINDNGSDAVDLILNQLNNKGKSKYKKIVQSKEESSWKNTKYKYFYGRQTEQIVIIYNSDILDNVRFLNDKKSLTYRENIKLYGHIKTK